MSTPYRLAFVCLGNICRSPIAHVVMQTKIDNADLSDSVVVTSCGTGSWHTGEPMDSRAADTLRAAGYDPSAHRARLFTAEWFESNDLLLTMDMSNFSDVSNLAPNEVARAKVQMFRSFDPAAASANAEVPDPWYGGPDGFLEVLAMVERTTDAMLQQLPLG